MPAKNKTGTTLVLGKTTDTSKMSEAIIGVVMVGSPNAHLPVLFIYYVMDTGICLISFCLPYGAAVVCSVNGLFLP